MRYIVFAILIGLCAACSTTKSVEPSEDKTIRALIVDGQNNHDVWPKSTVMMKQYLEETGMFTVDVARTAFTWKGDKHLPNFPIAGLPATQSMDKPMEDPDFRPTFSDYDVVISNFGWNAAPWPKKTQKDLEKFVANGGGFVVIHAADNSWPEWLEFNKMIALGGWGDRTEKDGPYVYYNLDNKRIEDNSPGKAGAHGPQHEYHVWHRDLDHPITKGLPKIWLHAKDELYDKLRGPALNLKILGTAFSDPNQKGTNRHEPMLMTIDYGKGKVFHTPMGHDDYSFECVGFITLFKRGVEFAATGKVTPLDKPKDFPTGAATSSRPFVRKGK